MCGIIGHAAISSHRTAELQAWMQRGLEALRWRGPDAGGHFDEAGVMLGSRRLRVHDVNPRSDQPMFSDDQRQVLVFNGAIHNYRTLRRELEAAGTVFHTTSDTEVAMAALRQWGPAAFLRFEGMFAIAYYDRDSRRLLVGRDRFGIKPLHYAVTANEVVFASEIKPLLAHPAVPRRLNRAVLPEFLAFQFVAPPDTMFEGISVLRPGCYLDMVVGDGRPVQEKRYWTLDASIINAADAQDVEEALIQSLEECWDADRPVGIQLSGGVDSSLVTALSHERLGHRDMNTYSVIFDDAQIRYYLPRSEEGYIRRVAEQYGCHTDLNLFNAGQIRPALAEAIWHHEQPLHGPSTALYMLLARAIRDKVTVLITGEGADDVFLGYFENWDFKDDPISLVKWFVGHEQVEALFGPAGIELATRKRRELAASPRLEGMSPVQKASVMTIETVLHGLLARHDRMFMASSIEGRVPFCTERVLKARFALPDSAIHDGRDGKIVLKKMVERHFDHDFAFRKKIGFSAPFGDWSSDPAFWRGYLDRLDPDFLSGLMDVEPVRRWMALPEGKEKWSGQNLNLAFSLAQFQLWHRIFIDSADPLAQGAWLDQVPVTP